MGSHASHHLKNNPPKGRIPKRWDKNLYFLQWIVNGIIALEKQQTFKLNGHSTNSSLPSFFTAILLHCHPTHPEALWTEFCAHICDDLARELIQKGLHQAPTPEEVYDYGLYLIEGLITQAGEEPWPESVLPCPLPRSFGLRLLEILSLLSTHTIIVTCFSRRFMICFHC